MTASGVVLAAGAAAAVIATALEGYRLLGLYQAEHYSPPRLALWLRRRLDAGAEAWTLAAAAAAGIAILVSAIAAGRTATAVCAALLGVIALRRIQVSLVAAGEPRLTGRATRTLALAAAVVILLGAIVALAGSTTAAAVYLALLGQPLLAAAVLLVGADVLLRPAQRAINGRYVRRARRRLAEVAPTVVGITGSYGKTTTKRFVAEVLEQAGPALPTPASFNSFLGVVRSINEELRPEHRFFVVEMGMYREGDIRELVGLVHPRIGVLTAIGPMHLERLGSMEAITRAKGELGEGIGPDGCLVVNGDDERCLQVAARTRARVRTYSVDGAPAEVRASDLTSDGSGTEFTLSTPAGERRVHTALLGRHNVSNVLAAVTVGLEVGLELDAIVEAVARMEPSPHRLQCMRDPGRNVTIIDDSYNANPEGAREALNVLERMEGDRRLLITPGIVELGDLEWEANFEFGVHAAAVCDLVLLQTTAPARAVAAGLESAGFPSGQIAFVGLSSELDQVLRAQVRPGDVILFENDAPAHHLLEPARTVRHA